MSVSTQGRPPVQSDRCKDVGVGVSCVSTCEEEGGGKVEVGNTDPVMSKRYAMVVKSTRHREFKTYSQKLSHLIFKF